MKALQVTKSRLFAQVQTVVPDLKAAGPDRIQVQPEWVSLCGSDIPFFTGNKRGERFWPLVFPINPSMPWNTKPFSVKMPTWWPVLLRSGVNIWQYPEMFSWLYVMSWNP